MPSPRYCESCGKQASGDARFCGSCGRPFDGDPAPAAKAEAPPPGSRDAETDVLRLRQVAVQTVVELLLCVVTVGIAWAVLWILRSREKYRVTTQRIEVRTGLVHVSRKTVELFRVHDLGVEQPFFLRMRGAGHLVVRSQDLGEPEITLRAIAHVQQVHERIRDLVHAERTRTHVRVIEEGGR